MTTETEARAAIIAACLEMNASGVNQGTSGNVSMRVGERMLITPSATPYAAMTPEMIASTPIEGPPDWEGPKKPSTEWRFHRDILAARPEVNAIVHAHPTHATAIAMTRHGIPAAHYMVAAFGGADVRCSGYATFGTQALSDTAIEALRDRWACLLANHGVVVLGESIEKAMWRAVELEALAAQYWRALQIGGPVILDQAAIDATLGAMKGYGV